MNAKQPLKLERGQDLVLGDYQHRRIVLIPIGSPVATEMGDVAAFQCLENGLGHRVPAAQLDDVEVPPDRISLEPREHEWIERRRQRRGIGDNQGRVTGLVGCVPASAFMRAEQS